MTLITLISLASILGGLTVILFFAFVYVFVSQRRLQNKEKHLYFDKHSCEEQTPKKVIKTATKTASKKALKKTTKKEPLKIKKA